MDLENILKTNFDYFQKEIKPFYFLLYTFDNSAIVISVGEDNLAHLLGSKKSTNIGVSNLYADEFYKQIQSGKIKSIFDLIDRERYLSHESTIEEVFILEKNIHFIELFQSLIDCVDLRIYRKQPGDDFDTDYLHIKKYEFANGYIGIKGSKENDYHFFNSVIYEKYFTQAKGVPIKIKKVERILKKSFDVKSIKMVPSKRNVHNNKSVRKKVKKTVNYRKILNEINKNLDKTLEMKLGCYGKNSIQIYKNGNCIENRADIPSNLQIPETIAEYINNKYK